MAWIRWAVACLMCRITEKMHGGCSLRCPVVSLAFIIAEQKTEERIVALPALPKGKSWYRAASTDEGVLREPAPMKEQKALEVDARTIVVLVGK